MNHHDHVELIRAGVDGGGRRWADFGSGEGAFTLALADLLGPNSEIYSIDRDPRSLERQQRVMYLRFPATELIPIVADFRDGLDLHPLDGIVMSNALHFVSDDEKASVVRRLQGYLRPGGRFVLVEYGTDRGNRWVPYPLSYPTWESLSGACGFTSTQMLASRSSRFLGSIYSALSFRPDGGVD